LFLDDLLTLDDPADNVNDDPVEEELVPTLTDTLPAESVLLEPLSTRTFPVDVLVEEPLLMEISPIPSAEEDRDKSPPDPLIKCTAPPPLVPWAADTDTEPPLEPVPLLMLTDPPTTLDESPDPTDTNMSPPDAALLFPENKTIEPVWSTADPVDRYNAPLGDD